MIEKVVKSTLERTERTRNRKRRRRPRWGRIILALILLIVVAGGIYSFIQYKIGLSEAQDGSFAKDGELYDDFNGSLPNDGKMNVLLLGSDSRGEDHPRTDSILIAHYDQNTKQPKIVSLMRDMYVDVPGHGKQKLNSAFAFGGPELLRKTIEENFGVDINYYAVVDFQGFPKVVDAIAPDGITVTVEKEMSSGIGMTLHEGKQTLHGDKLLGYVRFRHDSLSDFGRVQRQQEVLTKLKKEAASIGSVFKLPKLLGLTDPYVDTNIDQKTLLLLGKDFATGSTKEVKTLRLPLDGTFENAREDVGSVLSIDKEENKKALQEFLD
ncbi:LCP family protein [Priestia endophytica]|uniref:LCP family protein n=1 Tax=Priestia endophytica TaxID=135735 RepID=UPI002041AC7F|nr:LCP family protein [Priestia endophytica]MCM3539059.1 LCP family protein [Priestia endophytica]